MLLPKKRRKLIPRPRFFSSGKAAEALKLVFACGGKLALLPLCPLVALLPLASLGLEGGRAFSVLSDLVAGDRFSVPGVVTVRLGLWFVLRPLLLVAEGVEGGSEGCG